MEGIIYVQLSKMEEKYVRFQRVHIQKGQKLSIRTYLNLLTILKVTFNGSLRSNLILQKKMCL